MRVHMYKSEMTPAQNKGCKVTTLRSKNPIKNIICSKSKLPKNYISVYEKVILCLLSICVSSWCVSSITCCTLLVGRLTPRSFALCGFISCSIISRLILCAMVYYAFRLTSGLCCLHFWGQLTGSIISLITLIIEHFPEVVLQRHGTPLAIGAEDGAVGAHHGFHRRPLVGIFSHGHLDQGYIAVKLHGCTIVVVSPFACHPQEQQPKIEHITWFP